MGKENKTKKALSIKEWIFCIGTIIILTLLVVLPPVFRIVFSEDQSNTSLPTPTPTNVEQDPTEVTETAPIDDSQYEKMVCTKKESQNESYEEVSSLVFAHENGQLKIHSSMNKKTYSLLGGEDNNSFLEEKTVCEEVPHAYLTIRGFNYVCTLSENEIELIQKYDLANFKEKRVTINQEEKLIRTPYYLEQNVRVIRRDLEKQGYTCEEMSKEPEESNASPTPTIESTP